MLGSTILASEPVRVTGIGSDIVTARHDAFRKAIEYKIGSMVLSEKDVRSSEMIRNDILVYSAGYVDDYIIISDFDGRSITLDIFVSPSRLANRIISRSNVLDFQGTRHDAQLKTLQEEKKLSRKYIDMVMKEFPYHAIKIDYNDYFISENNRGQHVLDIPYTLYWNNGFLTATKEMLDSLKDKNGRINKFGNANIIYVPKKTTMVVESLISRSREHYIFDNPEYMYMMKNHMVEKHNIPVVKLTLIDKDGNIERSYCQRILGRLYNTTDSHKNLIFHTKEKEQDNFKILIDFDMQNITEIRLELARYKDCL